MVDQVRNDEYEPHVFKMENRLSGFPDEDFNISRCKNGLSGFPDEGLGTRQILLGKPLIQYYLFYPVLFTVLFYPEQLYNPHSLYAHISPPNQMSKYLYPERVL